jgi:hypothetical protein
MNFVLRDVVRKFDLHHLHHHFLHHDPVVPVWMNEILRVLMARKM